MLRPSYPQPEVPFVPFEKLINNVSFSFECLDLFVEDEGAGDKWKVVDDWAERSFASCL